MSRGLDVGTSFIVLASENKSGISEMLFILSNHQHQLPPK